MTRRLRYLSSAQDDLEEIANFIETETGSAIIGDQFADRLRARCRKLAGLPGTLGSARPDVQAGVRSTPHDGYVIYFRYDQQNVEIINILHSSRDAEAYFRD